MNTVVRPQKLPAANEASIKQFLFCTLWRYLDTAQQHAALRTNADVILCNKKKKHVRNTDLKNTTLHENTLQ